MAAISVEIPLDKVLLCDSRAAEVGDLVDLFLDPVKYPAPPVDPIRGAITGIADPDGGDPEDAVSILTIQIDDGDLPPGLATLEACDLDKARCADCCVRNGERLDIVEAKAAYFINDNTTVGPPVSSPNTLDSDLSDSSVNFIQTLDSGLYYWDPEATEWKELNVLYEHDATGNIAPPAGETWIGKLVKVTGDGTFDGTDWYVDDIAYTSDGVAWERIGIAGQYANEGVHLAGVQTITGNKTFTGTNVFNTGSFTVNGPISLVAFTGDATLSSSLGDVYITSSVGSINFSAGNVDFNTGNDVVFSDTVDAQGVLKHTGTQAGFYSATAVNQPTAAALTAGFVAGVGTSANDDSTYTGNTGTAAYTVGDIVKALKDLGLIASS